tara:strand:- start:64343 stop:67378 length:3036 start_codon:yes stop_codon:yes gene_type:complete
MRLTALALAIASAPAFSANFTVNTTSDLIDINPGDGVCATIEQSCSLRAAIQESNHLGQPENNILLPEGNYSLSIQGRGDNDSLTGDLDIKSPILISGSTQETTVIDAANIDRHFDVIPTTYISSLELRNISLINGTSLDTSGGSVRTGGNLSTKHVTFSSNSNEIGQSLGNGGHVSITQSGSFIAENTTFEYGRAAKGGAIYTSGSLLITNSNLRNNTSESGGAIYVEGEAIVEQSEFLDNNATQGGGLFNSGFASIQDSDFANNEASLGAAIYNDGELYSSATHFLENAGESGAGLFNEGDANIVYGYFERNTATSNGAGVYNVASLDILQSTGMNNVANDAGGFAFNAGNFNLENSSLIQNDALVNGGAIHNDSGNSEIAFTNFLNNGTSSDNVLFMFSGNTFLRAVYQMGDAYYFAESPSPNVQFTKRSFVVVNGDGLDTSYSFELASIDTSFNRPIVQPPSDSQGIDYYDGLASTAFCFPVSQNKVVRTPSECDIGSYESIGTVARSGNAIFASEDLTVSENAPSPSLDNPQLVKIPVSRSGGSDDKFTASYQVVGLSTSGEYSDFIKSSGVLTWEHGESEDKFINIEVFDDDIVETEESFIVSLSSLNDNSGTLQKLQIKLLDDEVRKGTFSLEENTDTLTEGTDLEVSVIRTEFAAGQATMDIKASNFSGLEKEDVVFTPATVTFEDGQTTSSVKVSITNDTEFVESRAFTIELYSEGNHVKIGENNVSQITVEDNDLPPTYGIINANYTESLTEGDTSIISFNRTASGNNPIVGTVTLALTSSDERLHIERPTITLDESLQQIDSNITILDDDVYQEPINITIGVAVVSQEGGSDDTSDATLPEDIVIEVIDNQPVPNAGSFSFNQSKMVFENEGEQKTLSINRSGGTSGLQSFDISIIEGTAKSSDVILSSNAITFEDGEVSKELTITSVVDSVFEEDTETLQLKLVPQNPGVQVGSNLTIELNDAPRNEKVLEKSGGSVGFASMLLAMLVGFRVSKQKSKK